MNSLDRATTIRRTVANKAYDLLKDCREPEKAYDGSWYTKEFWEIDPIELEIQTSESLPEQWFDQDEQATIEQVKTHVEVFLNSDEYESLKERVAEEHYQGEADIADLEATNRAHMPSWKPKRVGV